MGGSKIGKTNTLKYVACKREVGLREWRERKCICKYTFFKLKTQVSEIHFEKWFFFAMPIYTFGVDILHTQEQHNFHAPKNDFTKGFCVLKLRLFCYSIHFM